MKAFGCSCEKVMGWCIAQCKTLLFCAKTIVCVKKSHEEKHFWPSGDFLVRYFHDAFLRNYIERQLL